MELKVKGLFAVKEITPIPAPVPPVVDKVNYQDYGHHQAYLLGGSIPGLRVCLQKVYFNFKEKMKDDLGKQEELKKPIRVTLEEHKGHINRWENKIRKFREEDIPTIKQKIESLKEEKGHIRNNPQEIVGDLTAKPSFYIGMIILIFLTVYLFVFYSSASYSAFFKEFTLNQIGVANSIFDAQAISRALNDGVTELVLILTIPFVFLGLGYLIHKMNETKGYMKFVRIGFLVVITFLFDAIMAYDITEKIYNIKREGAFTDMPEFSIPLAAKSVNFWIIIFAGFIVYLIWGFVFEFVLDAYDKIDKLKVALRQKDIEIRNEHMKLQEINESIEKITHHIDSTKTQINKLNEILNNGVLPSDFKEEIFSFLAGWLAWMKGSGKSHVDLEAAETIVHEFVNVTIYSTPKTIDQ